MVTAKEMVPYEEFKDKHGKGNVKDFVTAMREIAETPHITGRPADSLHPGLTSETISLTEESHDPDEQIGSLADDRPAEAAEEQSPAPESPAKEKAPKKRKRESAPTTKKKSKKRKESVADIEQPHAKSEPEPVAEPVPAIQAEEKTGDGAKSRQQRLEKLKAKAVEKEKKKEELKAEKMMRKRQERLNQLKQQPMTVDMLRDVDAEIIESLSVGVRDVSRGLQAMNRLDQMPVTPALLISYPNILVTVRKCRKYVHDEQVRKKAEYLHNKFKYQMFSDPSLDPELLKKMKAIQMKQNSVIASISAHSFTQSSAIPTDGSTSQSQSPSATDSQTLTSDTNMTAALTDSQPVTIESQAANDAMRDVPAQADVVTDSNAMAKSADPKEETAVNANRSEVLCAAAASAVEDDGADEVSPAVAAVMENITDAVIAGVVPDPPVVAEAADVE